MLGELSIQIVRLALTLKLLQFGFLGNIGKFFLNQIKFLFIEDIDRA